MNQENLQNVEIKESKLSGQGLFARKDFKAGKMVLDWNPDSRYLSKEEAYNLTDDQKHFVAFYKGKYLLIGEPERHMNHSCDPNTETREGLDFALRNIQRGEEITGDYTKIRPLLSFMCNCGSTNCQKIIPGN